jgi:hypothetical protein
MKTKYSDSLIPLGIGTSFISLLIAILSIGAITGLYFEGKHSIKQLGGVPLLFAFLTLLVGPLLYNRKRSRFEKENKIDDTFEVFGTIQGLRGTFITFLIYEEGIEIRAFYHRYYLPFKDIISISTDEGCISTRLNIVTEIDGVPEYIVSSGKQFLYLVSCIKRKFKPNQTNSSEAKSCAAD